MVQSLLQLCPGPGYEIQASGSLLVLAGCAALVLAAVLAAPVWLWVRHRRPRLAQGRNASQ
jgi:hypothetical protein